MNEESSTPTYILIAAKWNSYFLSKKCNAPEIVGVLE